MKKTLFMLMSVDGKISTGSNDTCDVDHDFPTIDGVKEGLHQYYEIEQELTLNSFNTGRVMAKVGMNERTTPTHKIPCTFVILDNHPHLNTQGITYLCNWLKTLIIITTNKQHPAYTCTFDNLHIVYQETLQLAQAFETIEESFDIHELYIQSGGEMNGELLREHLIDAIDIVVAPILIGGRNTPTLIDGSSLTSPEECTLLESMTVQNVQVLDNHYVRLQYAISHKRKELI